MTLTRALLSLFVAGLRCAFAAGDDTCTLHESGSECTVSNPVAAAAASAMPYVNLGRSGLLVSRLSFGAWITFGTTVDEDKAYDLLKLCLDAGINFFDNAEAYGSGVESWSALKR